MRLLALFYKYPRLVFYLGVIVMLQTIYALIMTHDIYVARLRTDVDAGGNIGDVGNISAVTVPTVQKGLKYNTSNRDFIRLLDVICPRRNLALKVVGRADCPCPPPNLIHRQNLRAQLKPVKLAEIIKLHPEVSAGGNYTPDCNPIQRVALIIPVRNRNEHLQMYVHHMHSLLKRQLLSYTIFAAEQSAGGTFNKARVMNAGFVEAEKNFGPFDCYIFNDVDMLPEDDRNIQACIQGVRHLGSHVSKFGYKVPYVGIFGGVIGLTGRHFHIANGFSNSYVGWGGEDDDMFHRVRTRKLAVVRHPTINYYYMVPHKRDKGNPTNPHSNKAWKWLKPADYDKEGLNTLTYNLESIDRLPLYTRILVNFSGPFNRRPLRTQVPTTRRISRTTAPKTLSTKTIRTTKTTKRISRTTHPPKATTQLYHTASKVKVGTTLGQLFDHTAVLNFTAAPAVGENSVT